MTASTTIRARSVPSHGRRGECRADVPLAELWAGQVPGSGYAPDGGQLVQLQALTVKGCAKGVRVRLDISSWSVPQTSYAPDSLSPDRHLREDQALRLEMMMACSPTSESPADVAAGTMTALSRCNSSSGKPSFIGVRGPVFSLSASVRAGRRPHPELESKRRRGRWYVVNRPGVLGNVQHEEPFCRAAWQVGLELLFALAKQDRHSSGALDVPHDRQYARLIRKPRRGMSLVVQVSGDLDAAHAADRLFQHVGVRCGDEDDRRMDG